MLLTACLPGKDNANKKSQDGGKKSDNKAESNNKDKNKDKKDDKKTKTGILDIDFGLNGVASSPFPRGLAQGVAIHSDGKIVASGFTENGMASQAALVRYNTNGSYDFNFGSSAVVTNSFGAPRGAMFKKVAIQTDGKIVVGGAADGAFVARYNFNGTPDASFNRVYNPAYSGVGIAGIVIQPGSGNIISAEYNPASFATTHGYFQGFFVHSNGLPNSDFNAEAFYRFADGDQQSCMAVALQADGKVLLAGYVKFDTGLKFSIIRLAIDGSLDTSFGSGGYVTTDFGSNSNVLSAIAVQSDGKIIAGGTVNTLRFALARYNSDGSLDHSFGNQGLVTTDVGNYSNLTDLTLLKDGKILAVGQGGNGYQRFAAVRYKANGTLDTQFGQSGIALIDLGSNASANAVAVQSDGKYILAGYSDYGFTVIRLLP